MCVNIGVSGLEHWIYTLLKSDFKWHKFFYIYLTLEIAYKFMNILRNKITEQNINVILRLIYYKKNLPITLPFLRNY